MKASVARVASSATVVTLLAANAKRRGVYIFNDSTAVLYIKAGGAAALTDFTFRLPTMTGIELPAHPSGGIYKGVLTGIWAAANGGAQVTEFTA